MGYNIRRYNSYHLGGRSVQPLGRPALRRRLARGRGGARGSHRRRGESCMLDRTASSQDDEFLVARLLAVVVNQALVYRRGRGVGSWDGEGNERRTEINLNFESPRTVHTARTRSLRF